MLAPPKPRRLDQEIAVSLEIPVPRSNVYRLLEAKLVLSAGGTFFNRQPHDRDHSRHFSA